MTDEASELVGTRFGPYRIDKLLGEGAMGEVFLAVHESLGRHVAIKTLKPQVAADRVLTERFFAEARAVNIIRHENIVECTDLVNDPSGKAYIVMELLEGLTLAAAIRQAGQIEPQRAVRIAAQIADAIGAAHGKGIVHRDLKPDNVFLIRRAGSRDYVKVLDFGMARLRPDLGGVGATQSGALIGTPAYMSPEQARGEKVGPATDIYALGVVLYHMLSGQLPFEATSITMMLVAHLQQKPQRVDEVVRGVPLQLSALIARALAKQASERPADMATFRRELLESVGLPVDHPPQAIDSTLPAKVGSFGLDPTVTSGQSPVASAPAPPSTPWTGQTSLTGAASEVMPSPARTRTWPLIGGGVLVLVGAIAIVLVAGRSASNDSAHAIQAAPAAAPAPAPVAVPTPAPALVAAPARIEPPIPVATIDAGTPSPTVVTRKPPDHPKPVKKPPLKVEVKSEPAKPEVAQPVEPPKLDTKTDRTKVLVTPK